MASPQIKRAPQRPESKTGIGRLPTADAPALQVRWGGNFALCTTVAANGARTLYEGVAARGMSLY